VPHPRGRDRQRRAPPAAGIRLRAQMELALPDRQPLPRRSLQQLPSASPCAEPGWSISREPRREEYTICTMVAHETVFTVRTYGETRSHYGPKPPG
jgi:hypothetical protein